MNLVFSNTDTVFVPHHNKTQHNGKTIIKPISYTVIWNFNNTTVNLYIQYSGFNINVKRLIIWLASSTVIQADCACGHSGRPLTPFALLPLGQADLICYLEPHVQHLRYTWAYCWYGPGLAAIRFCRSSPS